MDYNHAKSPSHKDLHAQLNIKLSNIDSGKITGWMRFTGMKDKVTFDLECNFHRDIRGAKVRVRGDSESANQEEATRYMESFSPEQKGKRIGEVAKQKCTMLYGIYQPKPLVARLQTYSVSDIRGHPPPKISLKSVQKSGISSKYWCFAAGYVDRPNWKIKPQGPERLQLILVYIVESRKSLKVKG